MMDFNDNIIVALRIIFLIPILFPCYVEMAVKDFIGIVIRDLGTGSTKRSRLSSSSET
jgi:hypothetical protein